MIPSVYLALWFGPPWMRPWFRVWWGLSRWRRKVRVWQRPDSAPLRWPALEERLGRVQVLIVEELERDIHGRCLMSLTRRLLE